MVYRNWHISSSTWFLPTPNRTEIMKGRIYSGRREKTLSLERKEFIGVSKECEIKDTFFLKIIELFIHCYMHETNFKGGTSTKMMFLEYYKYLYSTSNKIFCETNTSVCTKLQVHCTWYFTYRCKHTDTCIHIHTHTHTNTRSLALTHVYIYIYIYIYIYMPIYV